MSEERRAVIEAALRRTTTAEDWVAGMAAGIERAVAEWERTREPTDALARVWKRTADDLAAKNAELCAALTALVHRIEDNGQYVVGGESVLRSELAAANKALRPRDGEAE
jgi:hypothetical protein